MTTTPTTSAGTFSAGTAPLGPGDQAAQALAQALTDFGSAVTWRGAPYPALVEAVPRREMEAIAEGLGLNAANADLRTVHVAALHFPSGMPAEQDTLAWDEGHGPQTYRVLRAVVTRIAGVAVGSDLTTARSAPATIAVTPGADQRAKWPAPPLQT